MKAPTIAAILLAAMTSISGSTPTQGSREEHGGRVPFSGQKVPRSTKPSSHRVGDWVSLATPTTTRYGTEWIFVGAYAGAFRELRIDAVSGTVHLRRIRVEFTNGKSATFTVDRWLNTRHPSELVDFGRPQYIEQIAITTSRTPAGSYAVWGSWSLVPETQLIAAE